MVVLYYFGATPSYDPSLPTTTTVYSPNDDAFQEDLAGIGPAVGTGLHAVNIAATVVAADGLGLLGDAAGGAGLLGGAAEGGASVLCKGLC